MPRCFHKFRHIWSMARYELNKSVSRQHISDWRKARNFVTHIILYPFYVFLRRNMHTRSCTSTVDRSVKVYLCHRTRQWIFYKMRGRISRKVWFQVGVTRRSQQRQRTTYTLHTWVSRRKPFRRKRWNSVLSRRLIYSCIFIGRHIIPFLWHNAPACAAIDSKYAYNCWYC